MGLMFNQLKPDTDKVFDIGSWVKMDEGRVSGLMIHAETLCAALSYMETMRVLCEHSNKDSERSDLFYRYKRLIRPRLEAIYTDWDIRN